MKNTYPETADKKHSAGLPAISSDIFYQIAENASDMIIHFKIRPEERLVYISPSCTRIIGYTPEEIYADANIIKNLVHADDKTIFSDFVHSSAGGSPRPVLLRWIHKNGNVIWTEQSKATIKNERGVVTDSYFICRDITDNKLAEIALQESQKFNASLLDNAPHAVMVINPDTSVAYVNPTWEQINGWTLAEVAGMKAPYPWWPDEFKESFLTGFMESLKQEGGNGELISKKKNGEIYWVDMKWTAVKHNGELLYILINSVDITERRRAEEAMKALSARQEAILSAVPDIIMEVDTNKIYTWANRAGIEFFGEDVIGKHADFYFEGKQDVYKKIQPLFNGYDDIIYIESWQRRKDGKKRLLAWWCRAMKDDKGKVTGALSSARDITENRQMEDALSREAMRRRILIEQSRDGIVILDQNGKVHEANRRFAEMLGYSFEEALQLSVWDWEYQFPREQVAEMLRTVDQTGDHFETKHRRKDGSVFDVEISTNGAMFGGQKFIFCVCRDMTEHNRAEQALRESEEKFSKAFTSSPNAICIFTIDDSRFVEVNESFMRFSGYSREEIIGHTPDQLNLWVDPHDSEKMGKVLQKTGRLNNDTFKTRTKSGEIYTGLFSAETLDINGKKCMIIVITDITEQVKAKEALRESEEKYSKAFIASPGIISITTYKEGKFVEVSDTYTQYTGYSREELIGKTAASLNIWASPEERDRMFKILSTRGRVTNEECYFRTKSGVIRTWLFSAEPINLGGELCLIGAAIDITERRKMEEALKSSEEKFRELVRTSVDGIISIDEQFKVLVWNHGAKRILGYTEKEMLGQSVLKIIPEKPRQMMLQYYERHKHPLVNIPIRRSFESTCLRKDGKVIPIDISVSSRKVSGSMIATAIIRDISERQQMEKALRESEEKFSVAFRASPDMMSIIDLQDGKFTEVNDSYVAFSGYSREELIGHAVEEVGLFTIREEMDKMGRLMQETGQIRHAEVQIRTKSGKSRTWMFSSDIITVGGKPCALAVATDITERKQAEKALRESEEKFAAAFNSSPDMMFITSSEGRYLEVNESYIRISGYTREEVLGRKTTEIKTWVDPGDRDRVLDKIKKHGRLYNEECLFRVKSGDIHTILFSTEILNIAGERCLISVGTDITERIKAEKALRESEEKFSLAFNSSPDMMILTEFKEGKYVEVNDSFVKNTGYSREELFSCKIADLNLWVNTKDAEKMMEMMQKQGKIRNEEYEFRTKSGDIHTWLCSADIVTIGGEPMTLAVASDITEQKKAREALRESEEKFSKAFHSSPFSISISRLSDGRFVEVNDAFLRDKGYTREEVIGHRSKEFSIWAESAEGSRLRNTLRSGGKIVNEEFKFRTKDGHVRTGLISAEVIRIGNEPCMLIMNNDITQQKQAAEQLRLLSSVTQQVSDSTIITDPQFNITYMNRAAQELLGYTIDEVRGKSLAMFNAIYPVNKVRRVVKDTVSRGGIYSDIINKKRKDGATIICDCRLSPLYDENGKIHSYIDVERDVTRQKEVEQKLQEHKNLIDSILATMPEGVLVINNKDRIVLANKAFQSIFHTGRKALNEKKLHEILPVDQFFNLHKTIKTKESEKVTLEFRYNVQNTEKIIFCIIVKMDGELTLLTFADVSRERDEEEKLYLSDRLRSLGEMAAGLAHELNNPLTGILALSQLLTTSNIPEEYQEDIECIHEEAKRAANIVKNVLLFARNKPDDNGSSSVNDVICDILKLREYEQKANNIKVVTNLEENLPNIPIDGGQMQQVFLNIISNAEAAIKETDRPGLITVSSERVNNHVNITFKDNGCGIKKNIMPRIFDPFFTTKDIGKGTGLGLSICYSIIVKHGGKINVSSQVNEGATFTIKMPIVQ